MPVTTRHSTSSPVLKWCQGPSESQKNCMTILFVGDGNYELITDELSKEAKSQAVADKKVGNPQLTIEILKAPDLDHNTIHGLIGKRIDYIVMMMDPTVASCLDKTVSTCSSLDNVFISNRKVEFCSCFKKSSLPQLVTEAQFQRIWERFQHPTFSSVHQEEANSVKAWISILLKRLTYIYKTPY